MKTHRSLQITKIGLKSTARLFTVLLLDTCTFLWLVAGHSKLSASATATIAQNEGQIFLSAISALEIAIKSARKKLALPLPVAIWYQEALEFHGVDELAVNGEIAITSSGLPLLHNDPFDRMIIATALVHKMPLATPDATIGVYPEIKTIW